jgi:hypothetical protein
VARKNQAPDPSLVVFRTYRLAESVRQSVRQRRTALGCTLREFLAKALRELPVVVEAVERALPNPRGPSRPARLPLSEELLAALRTASNRTGVAANRLLLACLCRATARKRRRRKE